MKLSSFKSTLLNMQEIMPSAGTNNILFRPIPVPRNGARVLPVEVVPPHVPGRGAEVFP